MKNQVMNPYLPLYEHIPDGEPHVFENRLWVFGSHDKPKGDEFCELDYVTWSAPVDDLSDWRYEGVIYRKDQDPYNKDLLPLYAPDVVQGPDGAYYLYYCIKFLDSINVARAEHPQGPYEFYGRVQHQDGTVLTEGQPYDPSLICTEEGIYLYYGFAPCMINIPRYKGQDLRGGSVVRLAEDMLTILEGPEIVIPSKNYGKGTTFEGNEYFEGPSIRKIGDTYYLIYSSVNTHQLCYAVSKEPMHGFTYGGVIVSNGDVGYNGRAEEDKLMSVGNNHGGLVCVEGQWYMFYHRHTSLVQYSRQGCAERVTIEADGSIPQVEITTSGLNDGPLSGKGIYPAVYCCNLTNGHMGALSSLGRTNQTADFPYIVCPDETENYITNIKDGTLIGYKYINLAETETIALTYKATEACRIEIRTVETGPSVAEMALTSAEDWSTAETSIHVPEHKSALYLVMRGAGQVSLRTVELR